MTRPLLAVCAILVASVSVCAAEPRPLWAIEAAAGEKSTSPGWLSFSPDGKAVAAVMVQAGAADKQVFTYTLRVWNAASRKERFSADLGRGKTQS